MVLDRSSVSQCSIRQVVMATDRRVARVSELIKREVSQMLLSGIKDERVGAGMVSVTNVDVSGDLQHAKVFVSIYGTDEAKTTTMAGLKAATSYVRSELGQRVRLRRTPEVVFVEDRSIERGDRVLALLSQISRQQSSLSVSVEVAPETNDDSTDIPSAEDDN
jgi:ribosome-binding factor A